MPTQNTRYKNVSTLVLEDVADLTIFSDAINNLSESVATVSDTYPVEILKDDWQKILNKTMYVAYCEKTIRVSKDLNTPAPKLVMVAPHMKSIDESEGAKPIADQIEENLISQSTVRRCGVRLLSYTQPEEHNGEFWKTTLYFVAEYDSPAEAVEIDVQVIG
jgi:hypothetical protein